MKMTILELLSVLSSSEKAAPIMGRPPRQGMPIFVFVLLLLTIPLKTRKLPLGTWTVVWKVVLSVVMPVAVPPFVKVKVDPCEVPVCEELSKLMSSVMMSELPRTGVIERFIPTSRYSMLLVEIVVVALFWINDPA